MIRFPWIAAPLLILGSCGGFSRIQAEFQTELAGSVLYAPNKRTAAGLLEFSGGKAVEFFPEPPLSIPSLVSLELEYGPAADRPAGEFVLSYADSGAAAGETGLFVLPEFRDPVRYAVPLEGYTLGTLKIGALGGAEAVLELKSLALIPRWYGVERDGRGLRMSPFVSVEEPGAVGVDVPENFAFPGGADLEIRAGGKVRWTIGNLRFEKPSGGDIVIPGGVFPGPAYRVLVEGEDIRGVRLVPAQYRPFPEPISLDPAVILNYPPASWRRRDYEVFRWDVFPSLLIFDTADYAVQDRLFKRLAFFVEKAGYRGRLAEDREIAGQHGWNAHDYRAQDLARFFQAARLAEFPLLAEERELEALLFDSGIIREEEDRIVAGEGGIISISRESAPYLRSLFMAHEGFHGVFFIDEEFREFSRRRWEGLSPAARRFILSYFDYQHYDTSDEYLVVNEFMAHVLQQPVSRAARYFGETLAARIDTSPWRRAVLPEKDEASGTWPVLAETFRLEAAAFDAYVAGRWGLEAGRVHRIGVRVLDEP
ncbi:MAG: hypothetical protein LBP20_01085 [Treponema sp.]|nr:hypothetical protein [Treponema sp.]